jgi:hypothetical protein
MNILYVRRGKWSWNLKTILLISYGGTLRIECKLSFRYGGKIDCKGRDTECGVGGEQSREMSKRRDMVRRSWLSPSSAKAYH